MIRDRTMELLEAVVATARAHFKLHCAVVDRRKPTPATCAAETEAWEVYHQAVMAARKHGRRNPELAEVERWEISRTQVLEEHAFDKAITAAPRDAKVRDRIRLDWNTRCSRLMDLAEAAMCMVGWPHRGERVWCRSVYYDGTPSREHAFEGEGFYLHDYDTHRVGHVIKIGEGRRDELHVSWSPTVVGFEDRTEKRWGMADPDGSIELRLAAAPDRRLPAPLPRWPKFRELGLERPAPPRPPFEQMELDLIA